MTLSYLDHRFDESDIRRAVGAVRLSRPLGPQDASIEEKAAKYLGVDLASLLWVPNFESKVKGTVMVTVVPPVGQSGLSYHADLVRLTVTPATPEAERLSKTKIEEIQKRP